LLVLSATVACRTTQQAKSEVKIVEGDKVEPSDALTRSVVLIRTKTSSGQPGRCSGSLLDGGYVLSAAHCFNVSNEATVVFGSGSRPSEQQVELPGLATIHPGYIPLSLMHRQYASNDVALVKIDKAAIPSYMVGLRIGHPSDFAVGDDVVIAGYGYVRSLAAVPPPDQKNQALATSPNAAGELYRGVTTIERIDDEKRRIFFHSRNELTSSCHGDSGGPMLVEKDGGFALVGIANSARIDDPDALRFCKGAGMYADVTRNADWIEAASRQGGP
jgi:secreted trypsin-like serine protease